jgi:ParB family chromosome partitioning protein
LSSQRLCWWARTNTYKLLGRATIPAFIRPDLADLTSELAMIDENLIRVELPTLERSDQMLRRKLIYEQLHPETKKGAAPGKSGGGKVAKSGPGPSFARDTATKAGVGIRAVYRDLQIAAKITPEAKALIRGTPLDDEKVELLRIARLPAENQEKVILRVNSLAFKENGRILLAKSPGSPEDRDSAYLGDLSCPDSGRSAPCGNSPAVSGRFP